MFLDFREIAHLVTLFYKVRDLQFTVHASKHQTPVKTKFKIYVRYYICSNILLVYF